MWRRLAVVLFLLGLLRVLGAEGTAQGQGFPFPKTPTRTPRPTIAPTRTAVPQQATPTATATLTPTRPPVAVPTDCLVPFPTPTPGNTVRLEYRWTGQGACFYTVASDLLGGTADVYLRINGGQERQLRWVAAGCWPYADDGTVPYAFPRAGQPPVLFAFYLRKGGVTHRAGVRFFPPSYVPESQT